MYCNITALGCSNKAQVSSAVLYNRRARCVRGVSKVTHGVANMFRLTGTITPNQLRSCIFETSAKCAEYLLRNVRKPSDCVVLHTAVIR